MTMVTAEEVRACVAEVEQLEEKILFVVGGAGSGKSKVLRELEHSRGWSYVEAKELLMEKLFEVEHDARTVEAKDSFLQAFRAIEGDVVILDSVEILFAPIFRLEPMQLLRDLSRERVLVVGWRGVFDGTMLSLEHNSKKDYFTYEIQEPRHVLTLD